MKQLTLFVIFLLCLITVPVFAAAPDLGTVENECGETVRLTPDADQAMRQAQLEAAMAAIDQAVKEEALSELRAFRLRREVARLLSNPDTIAETDSTLKSDTLNDEAPLENPMEKIRTILTEDWKEACSSLRSVVTAAEQIQYLAGDYSSCNGLTNDALKRKLSELVTKHKNLGYTGARRVMFSELDNFGGYVTCVYTGRKVKTDTIPNAGGSQNMNTEHTWPKSLGAGAEPAKADIFHLFPTDTFANSRRSSYPFGNVTNPTWEEGGSKFDGDTFMPRADHRGNVARAMMYFSICYGKRIDSGQERAFREWHKADPVDATEKKRNDGVCKYQGNRNPFIDRPDFVDKIQDF